MAGEIAQEAAIVLALSSAAIGAGGSVLSQVVGGIITSRREKKKGEAEDRRWRIETDAKRRDRGLEQKLALFSRFLATVEGIKRAELWGTPVSHETFHEYQRSLEELQETVEEVGLVAPEVYPHLKATYVAVGRMLWSKVGSKYEQGDPDAVIAADRAQGSLHFYMGITRTALRAYVNHEPVEWPEQAIAEFKAKQRQEAKSPDPV